MNKDEARNLIEGKLAVFREKQYSDLVEMIDGAPITGEITVPSGTLYQYEIEVFWDGRPDRNVRVMGAIDDGGVRAYCPLCASFIKAPDNSFIGE
jgi:hypothetical protein